MLSRISPQRGRQPYARLRSKGMVSTVNGHLTINLSPERLDEGTPEERAAFGAFSLETGGASLTEGFDYYINANRRGPLVSGYHAAEWFVWNWWRLLCEPRSASNGWDQAHCMASIGEGYVWPNITIWSDG